MENKLLSLEMQGYKTFASKTNFDFPGQLTTIVGPNGSGKSNIADAIRWVLGEQAYSLLRGKKTIDMIFSGSEQRPQASMASVSITFDNQTSWLPVEFSEVTITRRAYRSGENEYLLNNQKVRLKEINELLANSGLGERTYTIIGQGLVDTALSLKPEERRRFFEEASGIGLYRSRRQESVQKLDKTLRNMERVNDILRELKPRLKYLDKSREKANEYQRVQNDLNVLLKDWYGYNWYKIQKDLRYAIDFNSKQNEQLDTCREQKQKLEARMNSIQAELNEKRDRLANWHLELSQYHASKENATREIAVLDERERSIRERSHELESTSLVMSDELNQLQTELDGLVHGKENVADELAQAEEALNQAKQKLDQRYEERKRVENQIEELQKQIIADEAEILKTESRLEYLDHQAESENKELGILKKNQTEAQKFINETDERIKLIKDDLARIESEIGENNNALEKNKADRSYSFEKITELDKKHQEIQVALTKMNAELKVIQDAEESLTGFSSGSKEFVQAARSNRIDAKYALLLDYLKVPQEFEMAISAALGDMIEGVILDEGSSIDTILHFLENNKNSRTVLLPNWWKKVSIPDITDSAGAVRANELVDSSSQYSKLIEQILSTTWIVSDARKAEELVQRLPLGYKVVTKKGEVFDTRGTITAGKEFRVKNLSRKREKEGIQKDIHTFDNELSLLASEIEEQNNSLRSLEEQIQQLSEKGQELHRTSQKLSVDSHKADIEKNQKNEQVLGLITRLEQINQSAESRKTEKEALKTKIEEIHKKLDNNQKTLKAHYQQINDLPVEDIRSNVIKLSSDKAVIEEMANQHQKRIDEKKQAIEDAQDKINTQKNRVNDLSQNLKNIIEEKQHQTGVSENVSGKIEDLTARIKPLEEEVESGIKHQGNFLEEVDAGRNKYSIAERHSLQAQMKVDKLRDGLDNLRRKIQEDFGIISDESDEGIIGPKPLPLAGVIASLPELSELPENLDEQIKQQKSYLRRLGPVNPDAQMEFEEVDDRVNFLGEQLIDLEKAENDLRQVVSELDELMKKEFLKTFKKVGEEFETIFSQLFSGGTAKLFIEDEDNILESGIEIEARLPGKRKQELALLSGGERSLTAVALIFALLRISPTPFCVLDEVDAMLDESNVVRFGEMLRDLSETTQFIVITHNRNTVQLADVLYGVTMGKDSVSQVISLRMDELTDEMVH